MRGNPLFAKSRIPRAPPAKILISACGNIAWPKVPRKPRDIGAHGCAPFPSPFSKWGYRRICHVGVSHCGRPISCRAGLLAGPVSCAVLAGDHQDAGSTVRIVSRSPGSLDVTGVSNALELLRGDCGQRNHSFGYGHLLTFLNVEHFRFGHNYAATTPQNMGITVESVSESRPKEVDFKFDGEDLHVCGNYGECGVACGVIGHGSHHAGMNETVLLPMIGRDFETGVKPAPGRVNCSESTESDKPAFVVVL